MQYVAALFGPLLSDKSVWLAIAGWILALLNKKLGFGLDANTIATLSAAVSTYAITHVMHSNTVGKESAP